MATEKPRLSVTLDQETLEQVNRFRVAHGISTQSKAAGRLMELALRTLAVTGAEPLPPEAERAGRDYLALDDWGRRAVGAVLEAERQRMEEEATLRADVAGDTGPRVISLFVEPSAAGLAAPTVGRDYEFYQLKPGDPPGAAYAVRLQGDSMEPDFPDGSTVFVSHDALRDGDIGIFSVDGGTVCKQYHQEGGVIYLFSLNRRRADADVVLLPGGNRGFVCQGRVMTRRRYPVPGRG